MSTIAERVRQRHEASASPVRAASPGHISEVRPTTSRVRSESQPSLLNFYGFFGAHNRCYSKDTTRRLTDLAGFFVVATLTLYFTLSGIAFYKELTDPNLKW
jgi:hypothetical protein